MTPMAEPAVPAVPDDEAGSVAAPALLSVVKGEPTPEELAALTAVVLSLGQAAQAAPEKPGVRHWVRRQQLRLAPRPGPDAWRRSLG
ncbi:hypothetical protein NicSoilB8_12910 [Arthrobacter sp. NicSoilB8]|nr:hypothetical protein NicSoilB8_12910 [Arthrobacter sp. NicSoilB8]